MGISIKRGKGVRKQGFRLAEDGLMTDEQLEFIIAVDKFKQKNKVKFPTFCQLLEILRDLGYRKIY